MRFIRIAALAAALTSAAAGAADFPARPVRIVTTSLPGSATDVVARAIGTRLSLAFGQQFIVDNRPGAGGQIATEIGAKAAPDGHTLLFTSDGPVAISPAIKRRLPYDPLHDLAPVAFAAFNEYILVVHPALPVTSVAELVKLAKASPGKLRYGSAGVGSPNHMGMELFKHKAGIDVTHVPYKGGPAATADLVAGHIDLAMLGSALDRARQGGPLACNRGPRCSARRADARAAADRGHGPGRGREYLGRVLRA